MSSITQTQVVLQELGKPENISHKDSKDGKIQVGRFRNWHVTSQALCANFAVAHVFGLIGLVLIAQGRVMTSTLVFAYILAEFASYSITVGCHRLFAHRTFKAKQSLKNFLVVCNFFAGQQSVWLWSAWHRVHHKCVDTDADPHNASRGFFYSHIGWLLTYDHEAFCKNLEKVDMSDLEKEPVIMFHEKYYLYIHTMCIFILPTVIPWYFFGESNFNAFCVAACLRYLWVSHRTFLVNSAAHLWGDKPYDTSIKPAENRFVSVIALGEGWHNYHHVFPWDYKTSELGFYRWNFSTALIDFFAWIGLAHDLKSVAKETVMQRVKRTGNSHHFESGPWGWGDKSIPKENIEQTQTFYPARGG